MITAWRELSKRCPFKDERDDGILTITCPDDAPELHALASRIDDLTANPISHEELTRQVAELLPGGSTAVWKTCTAGWDVEVREHAVLR